MVSVLRRILRYAMTKHIFHEPEKGYVAHTAPSKALMQMPFIDDWLGMTCEEMWPAATKASLQRHLPEVSGISVLTTRCMQTVEALIKWPASEEPNHSVR